MMQRHFCEVTFFSDRLYLPGDFDSDLLQRKYYKEAESFATEPRKYRSTHVVHQEVSIFVCFI